MQRMHAAGILAKHHDDVTGRDISMCVSGYVLVDCFELPSRERPPVRVCEKLVSMGKLQHATKRMRPFVDSRSELYCAPDPNGLHWRCRRAEIMYSTGAGRG